MGRSMSHSHKLPGIQQRESNEVEFTIQEGALGVGVSQSKDTKYQMQFDYFTEAGNAEELSEHKLVPKMVLVALNGEDVADKTYKDLKLQLKEGVRPITMKWVRSEENLKMGVAHVRGGGIEELEEEWCDLELKALKDAGAKPVHVRGEISQERLRGTKTLKAGFRKLVWKDIFLEVKRDEVELWKTDARATSHGVMKLIDVKKICTRVTPGVIDRAAEAKRKPSAAFSANWEQMSEAEKINFSAEAAKPAKFPITITGDKLEVTVEWRPDRSPLHPFTFLQSDHTDEMDAEQVKQRADLTEGMALCSINGEDTSKLNYDETKAKLSGPRPLTLQWYEPPTAPARPAGDDSEEALDVVRTEPGILVIGPKEPGSLEIVTWDLKCKTAEISSAWQYAIQHNRALARRAAGIRPQRRRSASWG